MATSTEEAQAHEAQCTADIKAEQDKIMVEFVATMEENRRKTMQETGKVQSGMASFHIRNKLPFEERDTQRDLGGKT